jgi:galactokinase
LIDTSLVKDKFKELYGSEPRLFRAPGRVNLIGEHTDYNDGFVMPMAIELATIVAARSRDDHRVRVHSINQNESMEFELDRPGPVQRGIWLDYIEGVAQSLISRGYKLNGADLVLQSDVPVGSGLSSSAALEISIGLAMLAVSDAELDRIKLALAGQQAEHNYVGIKCGIMDQYIAALGQAGHALLIDCRSLEPTPIPMNLPSAAVVICDTKVRHELASSEYNSRRAECERGVQILKEVLPDIRALRDVSIEEFEQHQDRLSEVVKRRCRHVITENDRTLAAAEALKVGDLDRMGEFMGASHRSLRDDYEVSCKELDLMVEIAGTVDGTIGSRMTGGGFGGCTVSLVRRDSIEEFKETILREYSKATNLEPAIYISNPGDGAREI